MKKIFGLFILATMLLTIGFASASVQLYDRPCADVDLCEWKTVTGSPLLMPLGSENGGDCGLYYNTFWAAGTDAIATCIFDGTNLENTMLYLSIDNDIIRCTLNGNEVMGYTSHDNCAPVNPMVGGYPIALTPQTGTNTLVCEVRDRGGMSHFDACVVGDSTQSIPEFGLIAMGVAVVGALGIFLYRRK